MSPALDCWQDLWDMMSGLSEWRPNRHPGLPMTLETHEMSVTSSRGISGAGYTNRMSARGMSRLEHNENWGIYTVFLCYYCKYCIHHFKGLLWACELCSLVLYAVICLFLSIAMKPPLSIGLFTRWTTKETETKKEHWFGHYLDQETCLETFFSVFLWIPPDSWLINPH